MISLKVAQRPLLDITSERYAFLRLLDTSRPVQRRWSSLHQAKVTWRPWFLKIALKTFGVWYLRFCRLFCQGTVFSVDKSWFILRNLLFPMSRPEFPILRFAVWTTPSTTRPTTTWCPTPLAPPTAWLLSSTSCWRHTFYWSWMSSSSWKEGT